MPRLIALLCLILAAGCVPEAPATPAANHTASCRMECPGALWTTWEGEVARETSAAELTANCRADLVEDGCAAPRCDCEVRP